MDSKQEDAESGEAAPLLAPSTLARLEQLVRLARRSPPGRRQRLLKQPGRGIEPGGRRPYAPGDDVRLLDWPAYARLERLLIKVQEELPQARLELILDGSGSMGRGRPRPWVRAALAAAALAAWAAARQVRVTVWWAGRVPERHRLTRPGQLVALLRFLARQRPEGRGGDLERTAQRACAAGAGRGGAVLLSDGLAPAVVPAAARLRSHGFETLAVVAAPAVEVDPADAEALADAAFAELVDVETGATRRLLGSELLLSEAAAARAASAHALAAALDARGVAYELLDPTAPFESIALRG